MTAHVLGQQCVKCGFTLSAHVDGYCPSPPPFGKEKFVGRCTCGKSNNETYHLPGCGVYDQCVWCESNMGAELGEIHEKCKPLMKQALVSLYRWAERKMK